MDAERIEIERIWRMHCDPEFDALEHPKFYADIWFFKRARCVDLPRVKHVIREYKRKFPEQGLTMGMNALRFHDDMERILAAVDAEDLLKWKREYMAIVARVRALIVGRCEQSNEYALTFKPGNVIVIWGSKGVCTGKVVRTYMSEHPVLYTGLELPTRFIEYRSDRSDTLNFTVAFGYDKGGRGKLLHTFTEHMDASTPVEWTAELAEKKLNDANVGERIRAHGAMLVLASPESVPRLHARGRILSPDVLRQVKPFLL